MNIDKLIVVVLILSTCVYGADQKCTCSNLKSQSDCQKFPLQYCEWTNGKCSVSNQSTNNPVIEGKPFCSQYKYKEDCQKSFICSNCQEKQKFCEGCLKQYPCVWESDQCQFFTGCTAYLKKTHEECYSISKQCTTDQTQCIRIGECTDYYTQSACLQKNNRGQSCAWDSQFGCKDLSSCSDIPPAFSKTHEGCNGQLSNCTIKSDGVCIELEASCTSYTFEDQCKLTSSQIYCTWSVDTCKDKECEDAPSFYNSKDQCKSFMPICTIKEGGGCEKIIQCSDLRNNSECMTQQDSNGKSCYWISSQSQCVIHECEYAPLEYQSDEVCKSFKAECIANEISGCKVNKGCSAIQSIQECSSSKSAEGNDCLWDEKCLEKTCENASNLLKTHDQCEKYLFNCTTDFGKGCQEKTCQNAPDTMKTNEDCERYLPDNHCITRSGGGCTKNDSCSKVNIAIACVKDINGFDCYWYDVTGECITKQCTKAPAKFNTQTLCESFWAKCQVNSSGTGCEDKICENFRDEGKCKAQLDFYGKTCSWRNKCVERTCLNASEEFKSHEECNKYLITCTLSLSGKGCMSLPLRCEIIKLEEGCKLRTSIGLNNQITRKECAWKNEICQDKTCDTAPITLDSNISCQNYLAGCYVNNSKKGCWKLPDCYQRALQETCEVKENFDCTWEQDNSKCSVRTCASSLTNIYAQYKTVASCNEYQLSPSNCSKPNGKGCCTLNDQGNGCMKKPDSCSQLKSQANCGYKAIFSDKDCLWVKEKCVEKKCDIIDLKQTNQDFNHTNCYQTSNYTCTVNENQTACTDLKQNCSLYLANDQCKIDIYGNECVIRLIKNSNNTETYICDQESCSDVKSQQYNSFADCQAYNEKCTVIARVNGAGCVERKQYCFDYKFQEQCYKNIKGESCIWNNTRCWDIDKVRCEDLVLGYYNTSNCENVVSYCKANLENTKCQQKSCEDYNTITRRQGGGQVYLLSHCQQIKVNGVSCSINKQLNACVQQKTLCKDYKVEECYYATDGLCITNGSTCYKLYQPCNSWNSDSDLTCRTYREYCKYPDGKTGQQACTNRSCEDKVGSVSDEICKKYDITCTANQENSSCIYIQPNCSSYLIQKNCVKSANSNCIWQVDGTSECVGIVNINEAEKNCKYKTGAGLTYQNCQDFSPLCSVNREGSACVAQKQCGGYNIKDCFQSDISTFCVQSKVEDTESICISHTLLNCDQIFLGKSTTYTSLKCSQVDPNCTNQGTSGCTRKTCENAVGPFSHESCIAWKSTCTVKQSNDGCQEMTSKCSEQPATSCLRTTIDEYCTIDKDKNICVKKTCYSSNDILINDGQCENFMPTCTVAQIGGCQLKTSCKNYKTQLQCVLDSGEQACFWNPSNQECVDFKCESIEKSDLYDSHVECYDLNNIKALKKNKVSRCTVKIVPDPSDKTKLNQAGCIDLKGCNEYVYEEQCQLDSAGSFCYWNQQNPEKKFCEQRKCGSAPSTYNTHQACTEFQFNVNTIYQDKCTVAVIEVAPGQLQVQGCRDRASCEEYKIEDQCKYNSNGAECKWDEIDQKCYQKSCIKAPVTFTTHSRCNTFSNKCTVNLASAGCIDLTPKCEDYLGKESCIKNAYGNLCYWNGLMCVTRLCSNTPDNIEGDCSTYLATCESSGKIRCVTADCEQYSYVTDAACKAAGLGGKCTTDGIRCVLRKSCEEARTEDACKVNDLGQQCLWNSPTAIKDGYCEISVCELASKTSYISEKQCKAFNSSCTLKKSGGCKQILECNSFEQEESCTISKDGKACVWEKEKGCRSNDCTDLTGTDHFKCKNQNIKCTTSKTGKCVYMAATCTEYLIEGSCVETSDGLPCLWVKPLSNTANPQGQCIQYLKCEDIPLTKDADCKSVFQNCTSNEQTCTSIQKCENLNSSSCTKGSDGQCMFTLKDPMATTKTCMIYTQCKDAYYKTHQECQGVSNACTTSGIQCMELMQNCNQYTDKSSCFITKKYNDKSSNCVWNDKQCRDQTCSDISGATHKYCNSQMINCTSDSNKCMPIQTCESYTTNVKCNNGYGYDPESKINPCYWTDVTKEAGNLCRLKNCKDILPASTFTCSEIILCVYDSTKQICINKEKLCTSYTDSNACNFGTSDSKTCYWAENKCSEISGCKVITDQTKCLSLKGCSYITQNETSSCVPLDCTNVYQMTNSCKFYESFSNQFETCELSNGECKKTDPSKLQLDNCMINSNYTYTWSTQDNTCTSCTPKVNNTTGNETTTDSAQKISIAIIFLAMILG